MAATTSKPSPSNRPIDGESDASTKADGADDTPTASNNKQETVVASPAAALLNSPPTYLSVESSDVYLLAKRHLNEGNFEDALNVIEEGIRDTKELLQKFAATSGGDEGDDFALHEAMAPFHYLYGTTLLYSIEESDQEVTTAGSAVSTAVVSGGEAAAAAALPGEAPDEAGSEEENQVVTAADAAEDMEIAWENLEAARNIMTKMPVTEKLELDLAQVFLREGDLQRMNGRNENAIQDYQSCLRLRQKSKFLDKYDRKIADAHYNLGLVYINLASKDDEANASDDDGDAKAQKVKTSDDDRVKEAKRALARNKSVYHFLECSKCFCGQIANVCLADPTTLIGNLMDGDGNDAKGDCKTAASYKTTGEEDTEMELPQIASAKLRTLRKRAAELVAATTDLTAEQRENVDELCELIEDIQETVDEAENSTKGVQEVTNMKAEVAAMAAADGEIGEPKAGTEAAGATTTIGFGATSSGVAVATAPAAATAARPMMVVKKKKKRAAVEPVQSADAKRPKPESE